MKCDDYSHETFDSRLNSRSPSDEASRELNRNFIINLNKIEFKKHQNVVKIRKTSKNKDIYEN